LVVGFCNSKTGTEENKCPINVLKKKRGELHSCGNLPKLYSYKLQAPLSYGTCVVATAKDDRIFDALKIKAF
jgi:hypothetical protein